MKKLTMITLMIAFFAMGMVSETSAQKVTEKTKVEVFYTHTKNRCAGCKAIENQAVAVLNENFSEQLKSGEIVLHIVNIDDKSNAAIVKKYEIWGSSLFLVKKGDLKPTEDLTKAGFAKARTKPEEFRKELTDAINKLL